MLSEYEPDNYIGGMSEAYSADGWREPPELLTRAINRFRTLLGGINLGSLPANTTRRKAPVAGLDPATHALLRSDERSSRRRGPAGHARGRRN
jgi:hypothetical protein